MLLRVASSILLRVLLVCLVTGTAWAAESSAENWGWAEDAGRWFNLVFLFGVIAYFTREPIRRFLRDRREGIQKEISEARKAREDAGRQLAEVEARVQRLDAELEEIRRKAQLEAEAERERLLAQAEEEAQRIIASATREMQGLSRAARQELRTYVAQLSIELAEEQIKAGLDQQGRKHIIDRFIRNLGAEQEGRPS